MNCDEAGRLLLERTLGELDADDRLALEAHLAGCAFCRDEAGEIAATVATLRGALAPERPAAVVVPRRSRAWIGWAAAAVAALLVVPLLTPRDAPPPPAAWIELAVTPEGVRLAPRDAPPQPPAPAGENVRVLRSGGRNLHVARDGTLRVRGQVRIDETLSVPAGVRVRVDGGGTLVARRVQPDGAISVASGAIVLHALDGSGSLAVASPGAGAAVVWTGAAGDGRWATAANWSAGRVPDASDDVRVARLPLIDREVFCRSLLIGEVTP